MPIPKWNQVDSSMIDAIGHDEKEEKLYVRFKSKGHPVWTYEPVTLKEYKEFRDAPSVGSFFHQHIKTNPGITAKKL